MPNPKRTRPPYLNCGREAESWNYKYCSNRCQFDYQYKKFILQWKAGDQTGVGSSELVSKYIRRYLIEKYYEKRSQCGWNLRHAITGNVPLAVHHIDGEWAKYSEENLALLCPNCHALTANFQNLNRGKGRNYRRKFERRRLF